MSGDGVSSGGGFNPPAEPGKLTTKEIAELNRMFAGNLQQVADINARSIEQFARIIDGTRIKWLVVAAGTASLLDIAHLLWLAARFVLKF